MLSWIISPNSKTRPSYLLTIALLAGMAGIVLALGCGSDDPETIVISLEPMGIDFDSDDNLYFSEARSLSIWKFENVNDEYSQTGELMPPVNGTFSPWGIDIGKGAPKDILFVTDITSTKPRLLAVSTEFDGDFARPLDDDLLLAQAEGTSAQDPFTDELHGVASLYLGNDTFRVFVADGNDLFAFQYDYQAETLAFEQAVTSPVTEACPDAFREPYGLAVDPDSKALYVIDAGNEALFRFSGADTANPACDTEMWEWEDPVAGRSDFSKPRGVSALFGQVTPDKNIIVVADSGNKRVVAFSWDTATTSFLPADLPANFDPVSGASPLDLTFNEADNLWVTYPEASAISGE